MREGPGLAGRSSPCPHAQLVSSGSLFSVSLPHMFHVLYTVGVWSHEVSGASWQDSEIFSVDMLARPSCLPP